MRNARSLAIVAVFAALTLAAAEALRSVNSRQAPARAASGIVFDRTEMDAGVITDSSQRTVRFAFPFINAASTPLAITDVKSTCGCTVLKSGKGTYGPGDRGVIEVDLQLVSGTRSVNLSVHSSDSRLPQILRIRGTFQPGIEVTTVPRKLRLDRRDNANTAATLRVYVLHAEHVDVSIDKVSCPDMSVRVLESTRHETNYRNGVGYYCTRFDLVLGLNGMPTSLTETTLSVRFVPETIPRAEVPVRISATSRL